MKPTSGWAAVVACLGFTNSLCSEDWPSWLGPRGDSTWVQSGLPDQWPKGPMTPVWKASVGGGYAGIAVARGRVYTMDRPGGSNTVRKADGTERVICLDAASGELLWAHEYKAPYDKLDYPNGPRAMPTVANGKVFALGAVGRLSCLDVDSGRLVWSKRLVDECGAKIPEWGLSGSPLVFGDMVIVHAGGTPGGCLIAFDRETGAERWRSIDDPAGYATPILATTVHGPLVVCWSPEHVHGVDPRDGTRLWSVPYKSTYGVSIATPIVRDNVVFVSGYWEGSKAIELGPGPADARLRWEDNRALRGLMATPIHRDGYGYSLDKQFGLTCFEYQTGKKLWDDSNQSTPRDRNPQLTMAWLNDTSRVLILNAEGELIHAELTPKRYRELSRHPIIGKTWCYPAFADGSIFARSDHDNTIVRIRLTATPP